MLVSAVGGQGRASRTAGEEDTMYIGGGLVTLLLIIILLILIF